jgi:flavodoxin
MLEYMPVLVAYQSKYGSTRAYAEFIAKSLGVLAKPVASVAPADLQACDRVVFGGYLHVGKITGADFLSRNQSLLAGKKLIVFTTSGSPPGDASLLKAFTDSVPASLREKALYVPLPGRLTALDLADSLMMVFPRAMSWLAWKLKGDESAKRAYEGISKPYDAVDFSKTKPILDALR